MLFTNWNSIFGCGGARGVEVDVDMVVWGGVKARVSGECNDEYGTRVELASGFNGDFDLSIDS